MYLKEAISREFRKRLGVIAEMTQLWNQTNWVPIPALTSNCELAGDIVSLSFLTCETRLFFL